MWRVPRAAIGTVQSHARLEPMAWGLLGGLVRFGLEVQAFSSRAVPSAPDAAVRITGRPGRQLDSWLLDRAAVLAAFHQGAAGCQAAIVTGQLHAAADETSAGSLETLCQWLALPRIAVVDVAGLDGCCIPLRPGPLEGILLDRVPDMATRIKWQTVLEAMWDAPVVGWLDEKVPARMMADFLPAGQSPSCDLCQGLAAALLPTLDTTRLAAIAERSTWLPDPIPAWLPVARARRQVRIAVAYDDAFPCLSAETLEVLEAAGASVSDFSPLKSEQLPDETDVVFLGTGVEDRHWEELSRNYCLLQSLRSFAADGGRVYAEGTALAYLAQQVVMSDGRREPMAGLLPAVARRVAGSRQYEPVRLTTGAGSWLFSRFEELRGYRETDWEVIPTGPMVNYAREPASQFDLIGRGNVIASRAVYHFASRPAILGRFLAPCTRLRAVAGAGR